jgi:two-component system nitrate/nitrite response regulator NarL
MGKKIRLVILDDHQAIIDGYLYRLRLDSDIVIVATLRYGEELEPTLLQTPIDILLLDLQLPISPENPNPFPILFELPRLVQAYPSLEILVISMHAQPALIQAVMEAGVSGYILKDDVSAFRNLAGVVHSVVERGIYLSPVAYEILQHRRSGYLDSPLSPRQLEALSMCAAYPDASTAELADKMNISHSTMRNLLSGTYIKLNVRNRTAAILRAQQLGLLLPGTR